MHLDMLQMSGPISVVVAGVLIGCVLLLICGPPVMGDHVTRILKELGYEKDMYYRL